MMMKMEKPDLNRMWETFIEIPNLVQMRETIERHPTEDNLAKMVIYLCNMIRFKVHPVISDLTKKKIISWYHFLIHDRNNGVPTTKEDNNPYFHIRFDLRKDINPDDFLPNYCVMTRKIRRENVTSIAGIDKSLLKNEEIGEAWRIIGEQSNWLMDMLNIHKEKNDIPLQHVGQFLHFYANMTQLRVG